MGLSLQSVVFNKQKHSRAMRAALCAARPGSRLPAARPLHAHAGAATSHSPTARWQPARTRRRRRRADGATVVFAAAAPRPPTPPPHIILGVPPDATPAQARAAWVALIREAHPDVAAGVDIDEEAATARAAALNAAYESFRSGQTGGGSGGGGWGAEAADPAWAPPPSTEPPSIPFVDPFAVGVDPFAWRELQALARGGADENDPSSFPEARLAAARVRVPPGGLTWLTPAQAAEAEAVLTGMEAFSYDVRFAGEVLAGVLGRAAAVNGGGRPPAW
jgi:hypothetical protein